MAFVDSSFWIALRVPRDEHHAHASGLLTSVGSRQLVTSNHVVGESWTFIRRKVGHQSAVNFLNGLGRTPRLEVVRADPEIENDALAWLRQHDEREYSFVDATSFQLMRRLGISDAFAFDGDFSAAGFVELRP
ncbi:MAG: PIN domain-containing protein [Dehalococcoidia bacterium]|nr:PIN domain-containing protein [Dehalococcoidia bacterium]